MGKIKAFEISTQTLNRINYLPDKFIDENGEFSLSPAEAQWLMIQKLESKNPNDSFYELCEIAINSGDMSNYPMVSLYGNALVIREELLMKYGGRLQAIKDIIETNKDKLEGVTNILLQQYGTISVFKRLEEDPMSESEYNVYGLAVKEYHQLSSFLENAKDNISLLDTLTLEVQDYFGYYYRTLGKLMGNTFVPLLDEDDSTYIIPKSIRNLSWIEEYDSSEL